MAAAAAAIPGASPAASAADADTSSAAALPASSGFIIQSHRGAGALVPENTLEAFELGWELGTWPEADVRATSDGVIVAFHDNTFRRLVKDVPPELADKGVADVTWETLSRFDVGSWMDPKYAGLRVPKIADVFERMKGRPERHLYLDIKNVDFPELARLVREYGVARQVVLATPKHEQILEWKALVPESDTLLWMGGREKEIAAKYENARKTGFKGITQIQFHVHMDGKAEDVRRDSVDPFSPSDRFIREAATELEERGIVLQTLPWGGTTREIYWKLLDLGVDAFATDHPRVTLDAVRAWTPAPASPAPAPGNGKGQ